MKAQLTNALIELLKEKKLPDVSVSELTKRAGVGRVSFYRNYSDMNDILIDYSNMLMWKWTRDFETDQSGNFFNVFGSLLDHYKNIEFFMKLSRCNGKMIKRHYRTSKCMSSHNDLIGVCK